MPDLISLQSTQNYLSRIQTDLYWIEKIINKPYKRYYKTEPLSSKR
ncbi:MAG: hypothetical protein WCP87_05135 [Atribacterota bacterium]